MCNLTRFHRLGHEARGRWWCPWCITRRLEARWLYWQMDRWAIEEHKAGLHVRPTICKLCGDPEPRP